MNYFRDVLWLFVFLAIWAGFGYLDDLRGRDCAAHGGHYSASGCTTKCIPPGGSP